MARSTVLAIDVGTSALKAAVSAEGGKLLSTAMASVPYVPADAGAPMTRAFDVAALWSAVVDTAGRALNAAGVDRDAVAAVAVTSQRQGIAALDAAGAEVYFAPNQDLRALFEGMAIDGDQPDLMYPATGHLPSFLLAPAKLRWHQLHDPEAYERIAAVVTVGDWIGYKLTGELALQETLAAEAGLLDVTTGKPATTVFESLGLSTDCLPQVRPPGSSLGRLKKAIAGEFGIPAGLPVIVAGPDTQCGLLGMGVVSPGEAGVVAGWSVTSQQLTDMPRLDSRRRTWVGRHLAPGRWTSEANAGDGGNAYAWFVELLHGAQDGFRRMEELAAQAPPGSEGTLALIGPAPLDLSRPGMRPGGLLFPVPVTFGGLDRPRLSRAALENVAYAVRGSCDLLAEVTGESPSTLAVGGGMTKSALFQQVLTDVIGRPLSVSAVPDVSLLGAALAAEAALEGGGALMQKAEEARNRLRTVEPDGVDSHDYQEHYARWMEAQARLEGFL